MKKPGEALLLKFDWFAPFYERALPKKPPKVPTARLLAQAAMISYDSDPDQVPEIFKEGFFKGMRREDMRKIAINRIAKFAMKHIASIERYMAEEYDVLVVFQDGDYTSKGKRIVTNSEREDNVNAVRYQASWDKAHCHGTHDREDFVADQINRLQPKAAIERHKLVNLPLPRSRKPAVLPKPKGK